METLKTIGIVLCVIAVALGSLVAVVLTSS